MRLITGCLLSVALIISGCLKKDVGCPYKVDNRIAPVSEEQALLNYLSANSITTAVKHGSNMYYEVILSGSGNSPELCSTILIKYEGKLTSGTVFDSKNAQIFTLGTLIEAWKVGLPLIKKGGRIRLYVPPTLGYGNADVKDDTGAVIIPANSVLIFDITLNDVQ